MTDLITRLFKLDAPDREVDAAVFRYLAGNPTDHWFSFGEDHYTDETVPRITASVDAVIALAEKVLPGWWIQHMGQCTSGWKVRIETQGKSIPEGMKFDYAPSPAIALLIALLRAKEANHAE